MSARHIRPRATRLALRQVVTGLLALPLSALPLLGYLNFTPEGRLVRDRALVALSPPSLPDLTGAQRAAAVAAAPGYDGAVMALAYHGIGSSSDAEGGFVIPPGRFAEHLATLKAAGMRTVTAAQVAEAFDGGPALPPKSVMISFDDGRSDAMLFADPLLEQARMSATMFVITGAASEPGIYYTGWDKLEKYARSGRWDLQAHTDGLHREQKAAGGQELPALTSLEAGESLQEYRLRVRTDLTKTSNAILTHTGRRPVAFAYPFGAYGAERTNSPGIREVLRQEVDRRFAVAFHQDEQESVPLATPDDDRFGLRRLEVQDWSGMELLKRIAAAAGASRPSPEPTATGDPDLTTAPPAVPPPPVAPAPGTGGTGSAPTTPRPTVPARPAPVRPPVAPVAPPPTAVPVPTNPTPPTTTAPPPVVTTPTTSPPVTPPTTDNGCRSKGQGNVCGPRSSP